MERSDGHRVTVRAYPDLAYLQLPLSHASSHGPRRTRRVGQSVDRVMHKAVYQVSPLANSLPLTSGGSGIRTHEPFGPRLFKSLAFVRSAIPPDARVPPLRTGGSVPATS